MPSFATFFYLIAALTFLASLLYFEGQTPQNQTLENHAVKSRKISAFLTSLALFIGLVTTVFLPQNHKFWISLLIPVTAIAAGFICRKQLANFLFKNAQIYEISISISILITTITSFSIASAIGITQDQKITLENKIAIAIAAMFSLFASIGFVVSYFNKNRQKTLALNSVNSSPNIQQDLITTLQSEANNSNNLVKKSANLKGLKIHPKITLVALILLLISFYGFCCFGSKFLFFAMLACCGFVAVALFPNQPEKQSPAIDYLLLSILSYGLSALGVVLRNPMIIAVGAAIGSFFIYFFKAESRISNPFLTGSLIANLINLSDLKRIFKKNSFNEKI